MDKKSRYLIYFQTVDKRNFVNSLFIFFKLVYNYIVRLLMLSKFISSQTLLFYCKNDIINMDNIGK